MTSKNNGQQGPGQNGSEIEGCGCGKKILFTCKGTLQLNGMVVHGVCEDCRGHTIRSLAEQLGLQIQFRNGQVVDKEEVLTAASEFLQKYDGENLANIQILHLLVFKEEMDMSAVRRVINDAPGRYLDVNICLQVAARIFEKAVRFARKRATVAA